MQTLQFSTTGTQVNVLSCELRKIPFDILRNALETLPLIELDIVFKI